MKKNTIDITPFITAPIRVAQRETTGLLGFPPLIKDELEEKIFTVVREKHLGKGVVAQLLVDRKSLFPKIIIAVTFVTDVLDSDTGRKGLWFSYGYVMSSAVFISNRGNYLKLMNRLDEFIQEEFGKPVNLQGVSAIVSRFQKINNIPKLVEVDNLMLDLENEYVNISVWDRIQSLVYLITRKFKEDSFATKQEQHITKFWNDLDKDNRLSKSVTNSKPKSTVRKVTKRSTRKVSGRTAKRTS